MCRLGSIHIFSGEGKGKTSAAIGQAIKTASAGGDVVIIRFLKGNDSSEYELLKRLEPEIKVFSFEKSVKEYKDMTEDERRDDIAHIKNGVAFAHKVLATNGCSMLILDELLGLIDAGIISTGELKDLLDAKPSDTDVVITGITINDEISELADEITCMTTSVNDVVDPDSASDH